MCGIINAMNNQDEAVNVLVALDGFCELASHVLLSWCKMVGLPIASDRNWTYGY